MSSFNKLIFYITIIFEKVLDIDRKGTCLAFYKQFLNKENEDDFCLNLVSLQGSAGVSLYHALTAVYTPLLQKVFI